MWAAHARLHAQDDVPVVEPVTEICVLGWSERQGEAAHRIVIASNGAKQSGIHKDWRVKQAGHRRNAQPLVLGGHRTGDVVEIKCWHHLADAENDAIIKKALPVPELVKLGTVQRRRPGQAVVALHTAGLTVGVLTVELKELNAKGSALPADEFFRIQIRTDDQRAVPTPFARLGTAGDQSVRVGQPHTAKTKPDLVQGLSGNQPDQPRVSGNLALRRRVSGNGFGRFASELVKKGNGGFLAKCEPWKHRREQSHSRKGKVSSQEWDGCNRWTRDEMPRRKAVTVPIARYGQPIGACEDSGRSAAKAIDEIQAGRTEEFNPDMAARYVRRPSKNPKNTPSGSYLSRRSARRFQLSGEKAPVASEGKATGSVSPM